MLRYLFLTAAIVTVPLGAYLFDFRKAPEEIQNVEFVSAVEPESIPANSTLIDDAVADLVRQAEQAAATGGSIVLAQPPAPKPVSVQKSTTPNSKILRSAAPAKQDPAAANSNRSLTSSVLASLGVTPKREPAVQIAALVKASAKPKRGDGNYLAMTQSVLANLNITDTQTGSTGNQVETLEQLIQRSLNQGRTDGYEAALMKEYVDEVVNQAAYDGTVIVPDELVTPSGRVDTRALLTSLIERSDLAAGGGYVSMLMAAGEDFGRTAKSTRKDQFYVVKSGDSLAAISYRYYGRTGDFGRIFEANRDRLESANKIRIGQKLRIPAL